MYLLLMCIYIHLDAPCACECVYTHMSFKIILSDFSSHWSFSFVYESEVLFVMLTLHSMAQNLLAPFRKEEQELSGCYTRNWHSDLAT